MGYCQIATSQASSCSSTTESPPTPDQTEYTNITPTSLAISRASVHNPEQEKSPKKTEKKKRTLIDEDEEECERRKNMMDVEQRRQVLVADAWTQEVEAKQVRCRGCTRWIKLDQRSEYYPGLWDKHRDLCRAIKRMKGEHIPKRTRISKGRRKARDLIGGTSPTSTAPASAVLGDRLPSAKEDSSSHSTLKVSNDGARILIAPKRKPSATKKWRHTMPAGERTLITSHIDVNGSRASETPSILSLDIAGDPLKNDHTKSADEDKNALPRAQVTSGGPPIEFLGLGHPRHRYAQSAGTTTNGHTIPDELAKGLGLVHAYGGGSYPGMDYDDEGKDRGVFAPDAPVPCPSIPCDHRFRYSTQSELDTYFYGSTILSMANNFQRPRPDSSKDGQCFATLQGLMGIKSSETLPADVSKILGEGVANELDSMAT
ncbi:hypothetical protein FPV67DRAFT_223711 [Lyophyllum atratum]|nr:hypothetical protein FPV67DRAFT_223711 [Lyophyllum atratum]